MNRRDFCKTIMAGVAAGPLAMAVDLTPKEDPNLIEFEIHPSEYGCKPFESYWKREWRFVRVAKQIVDQKLIRIDPALRDDMRVVYHKKLANGADRFRMAKKLYGNNAV